jgi:hypothetical protein
LNPKIQIIQKNRARSHQPSQNGKGGKRYLCKIDAKDSLIGGFEAQKHVFLISRALRYQEPQQD